MQPDPASGQVQAAPTPDLLAEVTGTNMALVDHQKGVLNTGHQACKVVTSSWKEEGAHSRRRCR